jgi:hypothetical protein
MRQNLLPATLLCSLLGGCGVADVVQTGPATYSVSAQYGSVNGSWDRAQAEATAKARQFCEAKGQQVAPLDQQRSGAFGWTPQKSTLAFACSQSTKALIEEAGAQCKASISAAELDPLRNKIELIAESAETPPPFSILANNTFPSGPDRPLIARWATLRDDCIKRRDKILREAIVGTPMQVNFQQAGSGVLARGHSKSE